jgi:hypothetical protein
LGPSMRTRGICQCPSDHWSRSGNKHPSGGE